MKLILNSECGLWTPNALKENTLKLIALLQNLLWLDLLASESQFLEDLLILFANWNRIHSLQVKFHSLRNMPKKKESPNPSICLLENECD